VSTSIAQWPYEPYSKAKVYANIDWSRVPNSVLDSLTPGDLEQFLGANRLDNMIQLTKSMYCPEWIRDRIVSAREGRVVRLDPAKVSSAKMQMQLNELGRAKIPVESIITVMLEAAATGILPSSFGDQPLDAKTRIEIMRLLLDKGLSSLKPSDPEGAAEAGDRQGRTLESTAPDRLRSMSDAELAELIRRKVGSRV
jgi:hypothetical protein